VKDLIGHALKKASQSPDHAEDVLQFFCDEVDKGSVPDKRILRYLRECFRQILDGGPPSDALHLLRNKRGQRRRRTLEKIDERNFDLALAVARQMKADVSRDDAFEEVAATSGSSVAVVKKAYEDFRRFVKDLT
jgi:hypothetical protein